MSDDYKEHWTYNVNADEATPVDLQGIETNLQTLREDLQQVQRANIDLYTTGQKWMDAASKRTEADLDKEVKKYDKLRSDSKVRELHEDAAGRIKDLQQAIKHLQQLCIQCQKTVESNGGANRFGNPTGFPGPMGAFGATSAAGSNRRPGAASFNANNYSADNAFISDDNSAYTITFFRDGELDVLIAHTPSTDKPLKLINQSIEKFDGDITKFPLFRQQFLREAHRPGRDMTDTDRFIYLLSLLDGPARQLVGGIKPLPGCYRHAVDTLQERYGNEDELYRQLLRELKQLKPLQTGCNASQIEQFSMKVVQCLASMSDIGRADTSGRTLEEVEEKLPPDIREKIQEIRLYDPRWDIMKLHSFLLGRAQILRAVHGDKNRPPYQDTTKVKTAVTTSAPPVPPRQWPNRSRTPQNKGRSQTSNQECVFCPSAEHWGSKCSKYKTLGQRYQRIVELERCYICLNKHKADSCRSSTARDCRLCNERHHICFCPERNKNEKKASKTYSSTILEEDRDYNEPESDKEASDEASSDADEFDDTKVEELSHGTHAILSNKGNGSQQTTLLECVEVTVGHPTVKSRQCKTVLVFDSCSTQSFIQKSLLEKLGLPQLDPVKLSIGTFMASDDVEVNTFYTQLRIKKNDDKTIRIRTPVVDRLCGKVQSVLMNAEQEAEVREGSCSLRPSTETPEILIGRDLRALFKIEEEHDPLPSGFVLAHSNVGSMIVGRGRTERPSASSEVSDNSFFIQGSVIEPRREVYFGQLLKHHTVIKRVRFSDDVKDKPSSDVSDTDKVLKDLWGQLHEDVQHKVAHTNSQSQPANDEKLDSILHQLHSLEQMGVEPPDQLNEESAVHQRIRDSIRWVDGRYEVCLPWRTSDGKAPSNKELSDNFAYAFACLQALIKTLSKSPELLVEYDKIFKEYLASGIISEVTRECQYTAHYLSHHAVIKKGSATTKIRPGFNGSAKPDKTSPSLNDMLHKGPLLLNPITAVLLNSRLAPYVLSADIAKAFLQISVQEEDRHVCRFLWVRDLTKPATGDNLVIYWFNRVIFGLRPSPALLGVTIEHRMQTVDTTHAFLQSQLATKLSNVTLWTDSQVVFFWVQSDQKQPVFVENRLKEIRKLKELHQIHLKYVPTDHNPADVLSRGISAEKLKVHSLWWHGPQFLSSPGQWPVQPSLTEYEEAEPTFEQVIERELALATYTELTQLNYIVDPCDFNDWRKLLYRTYAYLFRTVVVVRALAVRRKCLSWIPSNLRKLVEDTRLFKPHDMASLRDLQTTESIVLKTTQARYPPSTEEERQLRLQYGADGLLRANSRLVNAQGIPSSAHTPIYLPRSTMDISKITLDEPLELDYDEEMNTSVQTDAEHQESPSIELSTPSHDQLASSTTRKCFEINGRVVLPTSGPIPLLDSHLHADEVEAVASRRGVTPPTYDQWSSDAALGQVYEFAGYVTVFCRPTTFLSDDKVNRVSTDAYYPLEKCLGACIGVHPGNSEDWHQDEGLELQLIGILLNGSLGQYPLVGLGECGLDYTKKTVVRDEDGRIQMRNGTPALSLALSAKRNHQWPVFKAQLKLAKQLRRPDGGRYPLVLHLRDKESMNTDVQRDALKLMTEANLPADYPIHFHFWVGSRVQYETWVSHFPRTLFGYNANFFKRPLTEGQLELLQTIPLDSVTFESDAPHHGTEGTSQALGTSAGLVFAITKFRELGKRRADVRSIALKSMENVSRFYRPDLSFVALPVADLSVDSSRAPPIQTTSGKEGTSASRPVELNGTQTMFELSAICYAGSAGLHIRCANIYLVGGTHHDGAILARDWNKATRDIADAGSLRLYKIHSTAQLILCCWGGRLLRDQPHEMVQFLRDLLTSPPKEAATVLDRWYQQITSSSTEHFRQVQESDVRLAMRKRFHGCFEAHGWLKHAQPPFSYEYEAGRKKLPTQVADIFYTIRRMMPEALSATFYQFVRKQPREAQFGPVEDLELVEEWYADPDQPGPSQSSDDSRRGQDRTCQPRFPPKRRHRGARD